MHLKPLIAASVVAASLSAAVPSAFAHADHGKSSGSSSPALELTADPLYDLPAFELTDQNGGKLSREALIGKVWVADFIFTSCHDECPLMTSRMRAVQTAVAKRPDVAKSTAFVSITTDPKTDTAATLKAYAQKHKADEANWSFLTGDKKAIVELSVKGFKLPAEESSVTHTEKFALVDAKGRVRGYYDSTDPKAMKRLEDHISKLAKSR